MNMVQTFEIPAGRCYSTPWRCLSNFGKPIFRPSFMLIVQTTDNGSAKIDPFLSGPQAMNSLCLFTVLLWSCWVWTDAIIAPQRKDWTWCLCLSETKNNGEREKKFRHRSSIIVRWRLDVCKSHRSFSVQTFARSVMQVCSLLLKNHTCNFFSSSSLSFLFLLRGQLLDCIDRDSCKSACIRDPFLLRFNFIIHTFFSLSLALAALCSRLPSSSNWLRTIGLKHSHLAPISSYARPQRYVSSQQQISLHCT